MALYKPTNQNIRKKSGLLIIPLLLVIVLLLLSYHQQTLYTTQIPEGSTVTVSVTQNFETEIIPDTTIAIKSGETTIDILQKISSVTTTFGGGYVQSINDIQSLDSMENGEKKDWFYYINGMLAGIGAAQYQPHPGDHIQWDYHDWSSDRIVTAIIGCYPEPFLHGSNGNVAATTILYGIGFSDTANNLQHSLETYNISSRCKSTEELTEAEKTTNNIIIIDTYDNTLITQLNNNAHQLGWYVEYDTDRITLYDETGEIERTVDHGGVICATQNIWNPKGNWHGENVIWIITGITDEDVRAAATLLLTENPEIHNSISILIIDNNIYKVPSNEP